MNSGIFEVRIHEVMESSYMQRHYALKCHFKFFQDSWNNKISDLSIHFVNVENLSWQLLKFLTNYSLIERW